MMRITAVIVLFGLSATSVFAEDCDKGLWGDKCNNVCVGCAKSEDGCSKDKGVCNGDDGCADGYQPDTSTKQCLPECFGVQGAGGCDNGGECVAPNYCICGKSGAQVVGVVGDYPDKTGKLVQGTQCVSLRMAGIKGALISIVVMFVSIGFCGFVEVQRNKGKSKKD